MLLVLSFLKKYESYLSDGYKSNVKETVNLKVLQGAKPVFAKARSVPIRLKESVSQELQRLVDAGIITKVISSDWASPTVNVYKSNGSIRVCGDFSVSVNQYLGPVQTPLPTIDEVIASVGEAKCFLKIDLSQAFLQLPLNDESKKLNSPLVILQKDYLGLIIYRLV